MVDVTVVSKALAPATSGQLFCTVGYSDFDLFLNIRIVHAVLDRN